MQIVRFRVEDRTRYGVVDGAVVVEYAGTGGAGDRVEVRIDGVGRLDNGVVRL